MTQFQSPLFAFRSFWPVEDNIRRFAGIGLKTYCLYPANTDCSLGIPYTTYDPIWVGPGIYDFDSLDRQIQEVQRAGQDISIICMVDINTPSWWVRRNSTPSGEIFDSFDRLGQVVSNEKFLRDTGEYLDAFLGYCESRYGSVMDGYVLACGSTCEWQDKSNGQESPSRRKAWREWMIRQGNDDPIDIPAMSVREHITHDLLRDPRKDALAVAYWKFCSRQIGGTITHFAARAQETLKHRALLGVYYGYILELAQGRLISEAQLDYERVFASKDLDFFLAPATYQNRPMGGASAALAPVGTIKRNKKIFLHEIDHRTHTANFDPTRKSGKSVGYGSFNAWRNSTESIAGLRREFAFALIENLSVWWFDMWGGWYDDPDVFEALKQMCGIWKRFEKVDTKSTSQAAMIVDPESAFYLDQSDPRVAELMCRQRFNLAAAGTPHEIYSFGDLADMDTSRFKLILLPNLYVLDNKKLDILRRKVLCDDKTVAWIDRPGVIFNNRYNIRNVKKLTGLSAESSEIAFKHQGNWTSVLAPLGKLQGGVLGDIAGKARCHIYSDCNEPLCANNRLISLHTAVGGKRVFRLPRRYSRIRELFSDRIVAEDTDTFEDNLDNPSTVLYELCY